MASSDEIKIIQFDTEAEFNVWKGAGTADILNIDFIPNFEATTIKSAPKVAAFVANDKQTDFNIGANFEYTPGMNQLMVFLNGVYLMVNDDYTEVDSKTIRITSDELVQGDVVAVLIDNDYFDSVDSTQVLNAYKILVAYRELVNNSIAQIKNITITTDSAGIYIKWEDVFGANIEQALGTDWKEKEGFKDNLEYMTFMDWAGVRVIRKEGSKPYGINDGTLVLEINRPDQYKDTPYLDKAANLKVDTMYYYGIFPYDGWGNYNTDDSNVVSIEFINQDWSEVTKKIVLTVTKPKSEALAVKWSDPDIGDWKGTKIVINMTHEPASVDDGTVVIDNNERNRYLNSEYVIENLQDDKNYYIKAFAYDNNNVVRMMSNYVMDFPIAVLDNITINFIDDSWKDYFEDVGITEVVDAPDASNGKALLIKPAYVNIDRFGKVLETVFGCTLKPVEYNRNGTISVWFKTRSNQFGTFQISLEDNSKVEYKDSGYYLQFNFKRFNVDLGTPKLKLALSCVDMNAEVLIDKIIFER